MARYDFTQLSSYDFELLVHDLLELDLAVKLESFTPGRDGGIDLRHWRSKDSSWVVQCKHFAQSGFNALLSHLRTSELPKIKRLKPEKYSLATSVPFTPHRKDAVVSLLGPYCKSPADLFGRDDLNALLRKYPKIEEQHLKLWLSSSAVLKRLLNSSLYSQSQQELERVQRSIKYYVQNESFDRAQSLLKNNHYCIIAGPPGIGKTTLADLLSAYYSAKGFSVWWVSKDISEADSILDSSELQLFIYDDFLGQTTLEWKLNKNEDHRLSRFIRTVQNSAKTRLVLTTREYILTQARRTYEPLVSLQR